MQQTKELMKKAITHKGYALLDIFQPCVSYNKINNHQWFKDNTYYLQESHDAHNRNAAFAKACETDKLPLGVFYISKEKKPFEENLLAYESDDMPLYERQPDLGKLQELINSF
jgi:2-oxoglutarate ferredoxin oxidoreductase subunit beta